MPFLDVAVRWCSCGSALFDVAWADGTATQRGQLNAAWLAAIGEVSA